MVLLIGSRNSSPGRRRENLSAAEEYVEPSAALSDGLAGGTAVRIERKFTSAPRISLVVQSSSGGPFSESVD